MLFGLAGKYYRGWSDCRHASNMKTDVQ